MKELYFENGTGSNSRSEGADAVDGRDAEGVGWPTVGYSYAKNIAARLSVFVIGLFPPV